MVEGSTDLSAFSHLPWLLLCNLSSIPILIKYPNCQKAHKSLCTPISAPGIISVGQIHCKPNQKQKQKQNRTNPKSKKKNLKYPNWKKAHKLITNPLTKEKKKTKPTQKRKKERKTLNTQIGKKLTQINNKPTN